MAKKNTLIILSQFVYLLLLKCMYKIHLRIDKNAILCEFMSIVV